MVAPLWLYPFLCIIELALNVWSTSWVNKLHGTHLTVNGIISLDSRSLHSGSITIGSRPLAPPKLRRQHKGASACRGIDFSAEHLSSPRTPEENNSSVHQTLLIALYALQ
jgi:hypothetical protein